MIKVPPKYLQRDNEALRAEIPFIIESSSVFPCQPSSTTVSFAMSNTNNILEDSVINFGAGPAKLPEQVNAAGHSVLSF